MNKNLAWIIVGVLAVLLIASISSGITGNAIFGKGRGNAVECTLDEICEVNNLAAPTGSVTAETINANGEVKTPLVKANSVEANTVYTPSIYTENANGFSFNAPWQATFNIIDKDHQSQPVIRLYALNGPFASSVRFPQLPKGTGDSYACLDSQGYLYRSSIPCV